jgi:vacuolar-type H+-ATPase subunit E/Vma4
MGCNELIESLRKASEGRVCAIWTDAEEEVRKIWADVSHEIDRMREEYAGILSGPAHVEVSTILMEAHKKARMIGLSAEDLISKRLFSLAMTLLHRLRNEGYEDLFGRFARELPPLRWQTLKVNPDDVDLARKYFPDAEIFPDSNIAGGFRATAEAERIRVVNTFEKRLERAWADLLPDLMGDVREISDVGTITGR